MSIKANLTLETIKNSFEWGKENLGEGVNNIDDEQIQWLINQTETLIKIADRWCEIEFDKTDEIDEFYGDVQDLLAETEEVE